jgi:threonine/homoserine/homoserine lactone efflux protein
MPETSHVLAFTGAALVLLLGPGPAVLFVVTRSVQLGRRAGLLATLGLSVGGLVHVVAAVVGLSAIVAASAELFTALKLLGAGYLIYLGIKTLAGPAEPAPEADAPPTAGSRLFLDGLVVNVLNPKPALFFLAFLPQFVTRGGAPVEMQLAVLGLLLVGLGLVTDSAYALLAGSARRFLTGRPRIWRARRVVSGTIYLGLGLSAALTGRGAD